MSASDDDVFDDGLDEDLLLAAVDAAELEEQLQRDQQKEDSADQGPTGRGSGLGQEEAGQAKEEPQRSPPPPPNEKDLDTLRKHFGHRQFRPMQWNIIHGVMREGRDQCVVMATGYGKSLCYQFPPVATGKTALVISPLIALMEDQVLALRVAGVHACLLGSAQADKADTYNDIQAGRCRYRPFFG